MNMKPTPKRTQALFDPRREPRSHYIHVKYPLESRSNDGIIIAPEWVSRKATKKQVNFAFDYTHLDKFRRSRYDFLRYFRFQAKKNSMNHLMMNDLEALDFCFHETIIVNWLQRFQQDLSLKHASFILHHYSHFSSELMKILAHSSHLQTLELDYDFTENAFKEFPSVLKKVPRITNLKISVKRFWAFEITEADKTAFEESFACIPRVTNLTLNFDKSWADLEYLLKNDAGHFLQKCLSHLTKLKSLNIRLAFSNEKAYFPFSALSSLEDLSFEVLPSKTGKKSHEIHVQDNILGFLSSFNKLKRLSVKIGHADIKDSVLLNLKSSMHSNQRLETFVFHIDSYSITDMGVVALKETISACPKLKAIDISLTGTKICSGCQILVNSFVDPKIPRIKIALTSIKLGSHHEREAVNKFKVEKKEGSEWEISFDEEVMPHKIHSKGHDHHHGHGHGHGHHGHRHGHGHGHHPTKGHHHHPKKSEIHGHNKLVRNQCSLF
jgi:hypothetical protein